MLSSLFVSSRLAAVEPKVMATLLPKLQCSGSWQDFVIDYLAGVSGTQYFTHFGCLDKTQRQEFGVYSPFTCGQQRDLVDNARNPSSAC